MSFYFIHFLTKITNEINRIFFESAVQTPVQEVAAPGNYIGVTTDEEICGKWKWLTTVCCGYLKLKGTLQVSLDHGRRKL